MLAWWNIEGTYESALVAAEDAIEAMELIRFHHNYGGTWRFATPKRVKLPGPPTVAGVYHYYGE